MKYNLKLKQSIKGFHSSERSARIIIRHFPKAGQPDHLILISWLRDYLKDILFSAPIVRLTEFNAHIVQHILILTFET